MFSEIDFFYLRICSIPGAQVQIQFLKIDPLSPNLAPAPAQSPQIIMPPAPSQSIPSFQSPNASAPVPIPSNGAAATVQIQVSPQFSH